MRSQAGQTEVATLTVTDYEIITPGNCLVNMPSAGFNNYTNGACNGHIRSFAVFPNLPLDHESFAEPCAQQFIHRASCWLLEYRDIFVAVVGWPSDFVVCLLTRRFELVCFKSCSIDHYRTRKRHPLLTLLAARLADYLPIQVISNSTSSGSSFVSTTSGSASSSSGVTIPPIGGGQLDYVQLRDNYVESVGVNLKQFDGDQLGHRRNRLALDIQLGERHDPSNRRRELDNSDLRNEYATGQLFVVVSFVFSRVVDYKRFSDRCHDPTDRRRRFLIFQLHRCNDPADRRWKLDLVKRDGLAYYTALELFFVSTVVAERLNFKRFRHEHHDPANRRRQFFLLQLDTANLAGNLTDDVTDDIAFDFFAIHKVDGSSVELLYVLDLDAEQQKSEHHHPSSWVLDRFVDRHDHDNSSGHDPSHRLANLVFNYDKPRLADVFLEPFLDSTEHQFALDLSQGVGKRDIDSLNRHAPRFCERKKQFALELKDQYQFDRK
ncbi:hypothetical protein JCM1841_005341 [Sporobolomyces salmonicolor]